MTTGPLLAVPMWRVIDENGLAVSGARAYFYQTGTTTNETVYQDAGLTTPHAQPVVANSGGVLGPIFLDPTKTYRLVMKTSAGVAIPGGDIDPVYQPFILADGSITTAKLAAGVAAANLGFDPADDEDVLKQGKHTIPILAGSMTRRTTNGPASDTSELSSNKVMITALAFDATTAEYAQVAIPMPKSWDEGTVTARFHWTAASGSGAVVWAIQARAFSDDDTLDAAFGTAVTVTDTLLAANDLHISSETGAITAAGSPAEGDLLILQIFRDASNGSDTLAVDAKLIGITLFITVNAADDT